MRNTKFLKISWTMQLMIEMNIVEICILKFISKTYFVLITKSIYCSLFFQNDMLSYSWQFSHRMKRKLRAFHNALLTRSRKWFFLKALNFIWGKVRTRRNFLFVFENYLKINYWLQLKLNSSSLYIKNILEIFLKIQMPF